MVATLWVILGLLFVVAATYPEEFPSLIRNPNELLQVVALETKRRWMILYLGTSLWISRQRMAYSLWKMRDIIAEEQSKQHKQETK